MERKHDRVHLSYDMVGSQDTNASGENSPIICLHGLTSAKETWNSIIHPIAAATGRKVYAYDARNHGDSGWSDRIDYELLKEDLLQFLECIHCQRAILIGHSMGGKTAMCFATNWPDRVEKLIVEDISPKPSLPHMRAQVLKYVHFLEEAVENIPPDLKDLQEAKKCVYDFMHKKTPEDHRISRQDGNEVSSLPLYQDENGKFKWKTNLKGIEECFFKTLTKVNLKGSFSGPTLILYGTESPYKVSADIDFIRETFPEAELKAVEGAAHQIHDEYEELFVKEVVDFINQS